jgi:nickel-dependent lactate racemase
MLELITIYNNWDSEDLIFPIVLEDAKIYDPKELLNYSNYWKIERLEMNELLGKSKDIFEDGLIERVADNDLITRNIEKILSKLASINVLTLDMHRSNKFEAITDIIKERLNKAQ